MTGARSRRGWLTFGAATVAAALLGSGPAHAGVQSEVDVPDAEQFDALGIGSIDEEPTDEVVAPEAQDEPSDGDNTESGSFRRWVGFTLIGIGVAIYAGGFWIYYRTRGRSRSGAETGDDQPAEQDDRGRRGVAIPPDEVEHTSCDWELHYWTGAKWEVLRPASFPARKCCVYKVRVETKVKRHEQAARFRQNVRPERLYIPDHDFAWRAMDFDGHTSTRSGPEGRLDWMQGSGDPLETGDEAPDEAYWQDAQGEEPPEVASHLAHAETTRVRIALESGCTDPENTYTSSGDSSLSVMATQECTNDDPVPECPVELNAFGWQWGEVWGELNWIVYDEQGTDTDELEQLIVERRAMDPEERSDASVRVTAGRKWDAHDHEARERLTYEGGDFDAGSDVKKSMTWTTYVDTEIEVDAAQLVPVHVWPTTERVTTHIEQQMTHSIKVSGEMMKGKCDATGCCTGNRGHVCNCAPEFEMTLDSTGSRIVVDGKTYAIDRDPSSADRRTPPAVDSPPTYRAWKLI